MKSHTKYKSYLKEYKEYYYILLSRVFDFHYTTDLFPSTCFFAIFYPRAAFKSLPTDETQEKAIFVHCKCMILILIVKIAHSMIGKLAFQES